MAQPLKLCTSSYCPVHTWSVAQRHARQQWFESQLGGTQPIVPVHAFPLRHWTSSACILHQGRSATWADSQVHIPRAVCYNQSLKKKEEFLVVFWRSTYFYFEAHNLLRHPKFSSTKLKKKKKMKIDSTSSKIPSGQVVRLATGLLHVLTQSYQQWEAIQPASNQTVPISFRWIWNQQSWNPTTAFPIMRSRSWHGERAGEIILLPTLSVLNGGVHCPRNPTQIWTLHQPSL